ncbi:anthranilate synthase component I [Microcoleus sp. FACHB-831]|uniref:anthranilate synthase component I n=1 Tax=Microcoleus sp. FACHB-831 TaxID=2692827 RepID=UPI0016829506|nr:anthranilate synthase component I [Microcoleus sp. FACHB-831]MBD1923105.1 anthranilate synthase component I [Microcoleus sp. FACHB-831]
MKALQTWHWRSLPLEHRTGSEVFAALFLKPNAIATLLESPYPTPSESSNLARYSICAGSPRILDGIPQMWTPAVGEIFPFLRQLLQRSKEGKSNSFDSSPFTFDFPFTGGWLGWLGYDTAWEIERLPKLKPDPLPFPVAYWYEPECFAVLDFCEQTLWLAATHPDQLDQLQQQLEPQNIIPKQSMGTSKIQNPKSQPPHFFTSQIGYESAVRQAQKYIQAGDIFQTNLSLRFAADTTASSWDIYQALQQINPSPFASYWQTPWGAVISCSPERLVQLQNQQAQTRPIAGTRSRGTTPETDAQQASDLIANTKEIAEHIMLVDLERNDLGRVCQWGSVTANELFTIERYSHVMHLVSNVKGTLRPECDEIDLIRALFPGGTITGCPKVRCMEIIEELEPVRRNLFYGSCGYLDLRGNLDLNILIRTLLFTNSDSGATVWGQVGAGIVADSDPNREWHESLHKAQAQLAALSSFKL